MLDILFLLCENNCMAKSDKIANSKLLDYYGNLLTDYQREILREYYDCDMSILEIADEFKISRQAVSDVIKRATEKLRETDEKLQVIRHAEKMKSELTAFGKKWLSDLPEQAKSEFKTMIESAREI